MSSAEGGIGTQRLSRRGLSRGTPTDADLFDGSVFLKDITVSPNPVEPGRSVEIAVTASNGMLAVPPGPNCCGPACGVPGGNALNGVKYEIIAELSGELESTGERCLGTTEVGTFDRRHFVDLIAPSVPGTYTVTLTLRLTGTGDSAETTRQLSVSDSDGGNGGNGGNGGGGNGDGGNGGGDGGNGNGADTGIIFGLSQEELLLGGAGVVALGAGAFLLMGDSDRPRRRARSRRTTRRSASPGQTNDRRRNRR